MKDPGIDRSTGPKPVDFSSLPLEGNEIDFSRIRADKFNLSNGIQAHWIKMGQADIFKIELIFNAGYYEQPANLVASFTNHLLKEGTASLTSADIAATIDFYGSSLSIDTDKDRAGISLYAQTKHLKYLLPVLAEIVFQPSFPKEEFNILLQNKRQQFLVDMQRVSYLAGRKMQELLYGKNHPYGLTLEEPDFDKITLSQITGFYNQKYTPDQCTLIIAGPDYPELPELLNTHLGKYKRKPSKSGNPTISFDRLPAGEDFFVPKDGALQNAIRIGTRSITPAHHDYTALKVLNTLFGGYFGSRLMKNIREDKGFTYGIGSALLSYNHTGAFVIYTETGAKVSKPAMNEIFLELEKLQSGSFDPEEVRLVKNYMIGSFLRSIDGVFEVAARYKEQLFYHLPANYYKRTLKEIQHIDGPRLQTVAKKYLQPSAMFKLMAGSV
jgi:zinc protease